MTSFVITMRLIICDQYKFCVPTVYKYATIEKSSTSDSTTQEYTCPVITLILSPTTGVEITLVRNAIGDVLGGSHVWLEHSGWEWCLMRGGHQVLRRRM